MITSVIRTIGVAAVAMMASSTGVAAQAAAGTPSTQITNSIGMPLVLIQPGEFLVGEYNITPGGGGRAAAAPGGAGAPADAAARGAGRGRGGRGEGGAVAPASVDVATAGSPAAAPADAPAARGGGRGGGGRAAAVPNPAFANKPYLQGGPTRTPEEIAAEEKGAAADRRPGFMVKIPKAFFIGATEVTQGQWKKVMGANNNPSAFKNLENADNRPVDSVTWAQAKEFVTKLNALEKTNTYRLPTEFEWEYAARAGGPNNTFTPDFFEQAWGGYNRNWETKPVATLKPNNWGLYDMGGNVWEWVNDFYNESFFPDPTPPTRGTQHVIKGGSFLSTGMNSIPFIHSAGPASTLDVGFRVVKDIWTQ